MAASRIDAASLATLERVLESMRAAQSEDELLRFDTEFHALVAASSGNETLASMLSGMSGRTLRARAWRGVLEDDATARTIAQHADILRALVARDPVLAEAAALVHVATTEAWFRRVLGDDGQICQPARRGAKPAMRRAAGRPEPRQPIGGQSVDPTSPSRRRRAAISAALTRAGAVPPITSQPASAASRPAALRIAAPVPGSAARPVAAGSSPWRSAAAIVSSSTRVEPDAARLGLGNERADDVVGDPERRPRAGRARRPRRSRS